MDYNDFNNEINQIHKYVDQLQRTVRKNLWYFDQEGLVVDRGDGVLRWKSQEELDECIRILGGDPNEIDQLCQQALQEN